MTARVEALWTKRAHRGVMDPHDALTLVAGEGIRDDANLGRRARQVTVISSEVFDSIRDELPDVEPAMRRANVMVRGLDLEGTVGRVLRLGPARLRVGGETRPCERMDEAAPGLRAALDPSWRGGVHGVVLDGGELRVGDEASWEDEA